MKVKNRNKGFTMAEMLIVIAIIGILAGIAFVGIIRYQKTLHALEMDKIAREVFVSAQNHLTMAESQGLLDELKESSETSAETMSEVLGKGATENPDTDIYYFVGDYPGGEKFTILDLMLPWGAIDDTIRLGGNYVIKYQFSSAKVLDVLYAEKSGRYPYVFEKVEDMDTYAGQEENKKSLRQDKGIGWYGGEQKTTLTTGDKLSSPEIKVTNAERLYVEVKNPNLKNNMGQGKDNVGLNLIVTSSKSDAKISFTLIKADGTLPTGNSESFCKTSGDASAFVIVLDDVASELKKNHFINRVNAEDTGFLPGENIKIQAVAYNNSELTNIAYSSVVETNSLYASLDEQPAGGANTNSVNPLSLSMDFDTLSQTIGVADANRLTGVHLLSTDESKYTAKIANFRHLENLANRISGVNLTNRSITKAKQISNMDWVDYLNTIATETVDLSSVEDTEEAKTNAINERKNNLRIYSHSWTENNSPTEEGEVFTKKGCYKPILLKADNPGQPPTFEYDGDGGKITNVRIDTSLGSAGLFETLDDNENIKNLELVDFSVKTTGENNDTQSNGNAGALVGTVSGNGTVENVIAHNTPSKIIATGDNIFSVNNPNVLACGINGNAGGLIGKVSGETASILKSAAAIYVAAANPSDDSINSGDAGGLIGNMSNGTLTASYSGGHTTNGAYMTSNINVFSKSGKAGGLVGDAGTSTIKACYSTCSVQGNTCVGGFVGFASGNISNCYTTGLIGEPETTQEENGKVSKSVKANIGAFAGSLSGTVYNCSYFEIINELSDGYLGAVNNSVYPVTGTVTVNAFDQDANTYQNFVGKPNKSSNDETDKSYWHKAVNIYDIENRNGSEKGLDIFYNKTFNLKTVEQLDASVTVEESDFVKNHYGDWPAPEIFVINSAS